MRVLQLVVFGVVTGSFLLLATIGFSLTRRVEGFLNIAHAQYMAVAAFVTWFLNFNLGWHFLAAAGTAVVVTAVLGLATARIFYDPLKARGPLVLLITSVGIVFVLQGLIDAVFGGGTRVFSIPRPVSINLGSIRITNYQIAVIALAAFASVGLAMFFTRTRTGLSIRAMAINRELAASRGVNIVAASRATWLVASGLAAVAGIVLGILGTLTPELAFDQFLVILAVAILAGLGSFYSVIAAALLIGLAMDLSLLVLPGGWRSMVAFVIVIGVLVFRPTGLGKASAQ
jgi:branched-chain amino acid transport system permease protein